MLKREASLNSIGSDGNTSFLRAARAGHLDKVLEHLKSNIDINTSNANGLNALHLASKDGHVDVVAELLKRGAVVDAATKKGNTALHIASLAGQEEVVKLLVQHGASVNVQSQNGFTPLYMAAQENHDNVVKYLLANGANQSLATEDGFTPLAVAMQQGHDKVVTVLLENDTRGKVRLPALHIAAKKDDVKAAKLLLENEHNPDVTSKSGFTPLHIASHYGNEAIANLLIHKGADVNYAAKHNITPLHVAAKWGKTNMVALLLEHGANIESKTRDGLTPLHCAARSGHEQVVDMLLERGAPISCKTKNGLAPLHMAAQGDHVDAARILLYHRAPVDEVTVDYLTALHVAAHCGHVRVAKLLLDRQADANARALNGFTPLHIACKKNRIKVVELLLKHGASIGATTESGLTPLHVASFMGCMNIVIYLLQHDANPDVPTVRGETPLHLAARANQTDIIRILLRNGAQVDARAREQQTPLHIASRLGNVDIVMLLLQHGAKVDTTTKDMYTALHIAAKEGQDEVAAILIENGASLNATTKKGFTPLHLAAKYGNIKVAKLLLQKEAPVDAQGKNGVTPLHVASHYDHQNVALLLLDKGASPHATAKNGHTPLHIAARKNQMDIANTLLEYGAKPNAESKAGFTPLHLSAQEGHTDMSSLLIEHEANTNHPARNGLTPLHLCAQEDRVPVAEILVKSGAQVDSSTKGGFTPLHIASHYGQTNMVKFLLANGANVGAKTSLHYTPLHQAAQQGHTNIVNILLENSAQPNSVTMNGQTPLHIAQKLGYISVIETLKVVTETTTTTTTTTTIEEKYKVVAPEAMQETFMSDSEEEGGEDTVLGDHSYRYLTADEMKSLGDDSLPIDVTRDERMDSNKMVISEEQQNALPPQAIEDGMSPQYITENYVEYTKKYTPDNVDLGRHPINIGFLVSFLVDARGGAMRGCRHSGVRVIVPPRCAPSPTRITCRYVRPQRTPHPPPLMEGEALASRVLELGPVGAKFLGPVIIEVPHFAALRGKEREIVILRSDNGETWREHTVDASDDVLNEVLNDSFEAEDLSQLEDISSGRITRVVTHDFPQYFAIVTRIRQEVHAIGPEGGMVSSTVVPQVQAVFPQGALTKKIKVGLQAQPIDPELTAKLLGHGVAVSPVVTVEPRRRKFHKAITLSMPAPRAHSQGMINQYSGNAPTLRLLCSITGGTTRAQWEDVTGSTPLTFVNDCVSFTTTVSARFWLMDCRNIGDATKMATELYKEAIHVPFMAKFVVFAKRIDPLEARLRVFCMTDDKEDKTLEHQEHFTEVAKSRDVEVLEGKPQYIEFAGNLVPITKSGEPLQFSFRAFRENRLPFSVRVKDQHAEAVGRCLFMREPKVAKGEPPQQPICILNIVLPDDIVTETVALTDNDTFKRHIFLKDNFEYYRPDPRLADMSNLLGEDWVPLATQLGLTPSEINVIKSEYPDSVAKQAQSMLRMWISQSGNKAQGDALENALMRIGREDIIPQCLNVDDVERIPRIPKDVMERYQKDIDITLETPPKQKETYESKYSAEEKIVDEPSDEEDFNKSVSERRQQIEKRLTERNIPASSQRQEIVEEITSIKRQSMVEDKIFEAEIKQKPDPTKTTTIIKTVTTDVPDSKKTVAETVEMTKTTIPSDYQPTEVTVTKQFMEEEQPDRKTTVRTIITETRTTEHIPSNEIQLPTDVKADRRDSELLEGVTQRLETTKKMAPRISAIDADPNSPKFSKTPPPSPADFIFKEQAAIIQGWSAPDAESKDKPAVAVAKQGAAMQGIPTSTTTKHLASSEELSLDSPKLERPLANDNDLNNLAQQTNAFIDIESRREPDNELRADRESRLTKSKSDEKTKTLSRDSSREDTSRSDEKKAKKGFFGTLKSIVGKSQDRSDSESEKSQKKEKKKEKRKDKKKKPKLPHGKPPLEPPERPPRKPKLPTPPPVTDEHPDFADIPYVEASPTEHMNGISEMHDIEPIETTDLDAMNDIPEHVKSAATDLVTDIITTSETKAQEIVEKSPGGKKIIIKEELKKTIEPKIYDAGEFRVIVTPMKEPKAKDYIKVDVDESKIEIQQTTPAIEPPVRPQRKKEHIYEDIGEPINTQLPTKLILFDDEPIPDIKIQTANLIQSEINFAGWADDKHNIYKPVEIKEKEHTLTRSSKRHGKLFGFLGKKSSKEVDESDNEKDSQKEIIEKQDREPSKERTIKADSLSDDDGADQKKGGFFGIFGKKSKKEDEHKEDKEIFEREPEVAITFAADTVREKSPEKKVKSEVKELQVAPIEKDIPPEPKIREKKKLKKEKVLSDSEDESEHKKSGLFGLFGKKGKKDIKEEPPKAIQISEAVIKDMNDTSQFLLNEVKYFEDVKVVSSKPSAELIVVPTEGSKPEVAIKETAQIKSTLDKPESEVSTQEREKTPVKTKRQKHRPEKRESSVSEDESEGRKSGLFGLFGKKHKKDKSKERSPKPPEVPKMSDETVKQITDTSNFLVKEVEQFDDVRPINGCANGSAIHEPLIIKEQVTRKDKPEEPISRDTKIERTIIKEVAKIDPNSKEEVLTSATQIIRETVTTRSIIEVPSTEKHTKIIEETLVPPVEEKTIIKETIVKSVDGKPVRQEQTIEKVPKPQVNDQLIQVLVENASFLQDEINHFDDVKPIPREPLIIKESVEDKRETPVKEIPQELDKKKGGFFGLFGKKPKKDDGKDKKEGEEMLPKDEELKQFMVDSTNFLTNEVSNFEDVRPIIKPIEETFEKVSIVKPIAKVEVQKAEKDQAIAEVDKIKEKKDKTELEFQEGIEKEKKGFFDIFGKKGKKDEKVKTKDEVSKEIKLSEEAIKSMETSNEFLTREITQFDDVKPVTPTIEEKFEKVLIVKSIPFDETQIIEKLSVETSKTSAALEDEVDKLKAVKKAESPEKSSKEATPPTLPKEEVKKEKVGTLEKKKSKKDKPESEESESQKKGGFLGLFGKKSKKEDKEDKPVEKQELSEEIHKNLTATNEFLCKEVAVFEDVRPVISKTVSESPKAQTQQADVAEAAKTKIVQNNDFLKEEVERFDDVKQIISKAPGELTPKATHVIKETIIVRGDVTDEELQKILDESDQIKEEPIIKDHVTLDDKGKPQKISKKPSEEDEEDDRKGVFFGLFGKISKKESEKTEVAKLKMSQTDDFLKGEVERFDDVKQILLKSAAKTVSFERKPKEPTPKPTHIIKETIIVQGDLPDEEIKRILDESDQIKEAVAVKEQVTLDKKKKPKEEQAIIEESEVEKKGFFGLFGKKSKKDEVLSDEDTTEEARKVIDNCDKFLTDEIARFEDVRPIVKKDVEKIPTESVGSPYDTEVKEDVIVKEQVRLDQKKKPKLDEKASSEEPEEKKSGGFFGLFGRKSKKDDKICDEQTPKEERVNVENCNDFLANEIARFEDVMPVIKKEVLEKPIEGVDSKQTTSQIEDENTKLNRAQTADFLKEEVDRFNDVKEILPKSPEKSTPKATHVIKERIVIHGDLPDEEIRKILDETDQVKENAIVKEQVKLDEKKKPKRDEKASSEEPEDKKKAGFFGLFSKKTKKDEAVPDQHATEEAQRVIENTDQFLITEVTKFDDVKPIIVTESMDQSTIKIKEPKVKVEHVDQDENAELKKAQTSDFLKEEIKRFHDVKEILPILPDKSIPKTSQESKPVKENIIVKEQAKLDKKKKPKRDEKESSEEPEDKKKGGFFGIFGKKTKKDEKVIDEQASKEMRKTIENCDQFLENEVARFEDVMPVIRTEAKEPEQKTESTPLKIKPEKDEEAILRKAQTADFLKEEVDRFDDVKEILSKSPKKFTPKATHVIKERIVIQGDLPDEEIRKILDEADQVKEDVIVKEQVKLKEKKKPKRDEKASSEEPDDKKKGGGFFGLFGMKSKKDEKVADEQDSEEARLAIDNCNQFLANEVARFQDVMPIRTEVKEKMQETESKPEQDENSKLKRAQTAEFLKEELDRFDDVKEILFKSPEKTTPRATHVIKERIVVQSDLPDEEIRKILDETDQVKEDIIVKEQVISDEKKKPIRNEKESSEEPEEKNKGGFFGIFGKKPKKDEALPDKQESEEVRKSIENCNQFLVNEVARFEDVMPVIKEEIKKKTIQKTETKPEQDENKLKKAQTADFLKEEVDRFNDVKEIPPKSPERSTPKATHVIKEKIVIQGNLSDEEIRRILDEADQVKEDVIVKEQVKVKEKKKPKRDEKASSEEPEDKKKGGGFFGLFGKKSKKDEAVTDEKASEEARLAIDNCDQFLANEVARFEDVMPIIEKEVEEKIPKMESKPSKSKPEEDEDAKLKRAQTADFLKEELDRFNDVKQIPPKSPERSTPKATHIIKERITVESSLPDEELRKIFDETGQVKEDLIVKKQVKLEEKKKPKREEKAISEEPEEKKKGGFFGLFSKKSKKDEKLLDEQASEEARKSIENCDQFLANEVVCFEDVMPIIKKEVKEEVKKIETKPFKTEPQQDKDPKLRRTQTTEFLKEEIDRFDDMKEILPKSPEKSTPKATHVIKERIVLQGDLSDIEIKKILDETDNVKEEKIAKEHVILDEKKKLKREERASSEESEDKNKSGFFGLFAKKSKKDEKVQDEQASEEACLAIKNCEQFLIDEIARFEDVRPIIQKELSEEPVHKVDSASVNTEPEEEDGKLRRAQTIEFLKEEVNRFEDVKEIVPKLQEKSTPEAMPVITDQIKLDSLTKEEVKLGESKKSKQDDRQSSEESEEKKRGGFFGLFGKKSKKEEKQLSEGERTQKSEYTKEASPPKALKRTPSEEHEDNIFQTASFLASEKDFSDEVPQAPKPIVAEVAAKLEPTETSPKKGKKKKKGKRESSESGDESDGSKKSGLFKLFGKKGKKDVDEDKLKSEGDDPKSKSSTLESQTASLVEEKAKPERKSSQKKAKKEKAQEDSSKPLFGIFSKKEKVTEVPMEPEKIVSEAVEKDMQNTSDFLKTEIVKFDDVKVSKKEEKIIKSDVSLDGKMTIAEITKTLEPKTYETGEFQVVVSPTGEPKKREFSVSMGEKVKKMQKQILPTGEIVTSELPIITHKKLIIKSIPRIPSDEDVSKIQTLRISEKATPQMELSQEVLKNMIDTSNFLNQEISRFNDVRPVKHEREKSPASEDEDAKDKRKRKKKPRQKSIEDDSSRKSGFFGLFGKKEKKPEVAESVSDVKKPEEKKEKVIQPEIIKQEEHSVNVPAPLDFVESVHSTNNFLNDEIKNYHDVKPLPQTIQTIQQPQTISTSEAKPDITQKEQEPKGKSKSLFGLFGKKSDEHTEEQQPQKEITLKEKRERRKSSSPFRLFSKKSKDEEKVEETEPIISEQALQDMYETKNFLSTEVMRYSDAPYIPGEKQPAEIKKSVAFEEAVIKISDLESGAVASTTIIVKETLDDGKVKVETILKEIKEDMQPTEKVIVVIKDDASDAAKSVNEMTFSPPDIISNIMANVPTDSTIKEICIEAIEEGTGKPVAITTQQIEKISTSFQEKDMKPIIVSDFLPTTAEDKFDMEGFISSERSLADVDVTVSKPKPDDDIGQKFEEITKDVLELTKELDATVELIEEKTSNEKDELKKESKKAAKKSGGFFSKLGEKIGGKTKQAKDVIEDAGLKTEKAITQQVEQTVDVTKPVAVSITKDSVKEKATKNIKALEAETSKTAVEVTDIGQIVQSEIDKITKELEDTSGKAGKIKSDTKDRISTSIKESLKESEKSEIKVMSSAEAPESETKDESKKAAKKSGRFLGKLGDKLSGKTKDVKTDGKFLVEKTEDDIISTSEDKLTKAKDTSDTTKPEITDKLQEMLEAGTIAVGEIESDIKEQMKGAQDIGKETIDNLKDGAEHKDIVKGVKEIPTFITATDDTMKHVPDSIKDQTKEFITEVIKADQQEAPEIKFRLDKTQEIAPDSAETKDASRSRKKPKKPRKKSGGFFSKIGGIFTDKEESSSKEKPESGIAQGISDLPRKTVDAVEKTTKESAKDTGELVTDAQDKSQKFEQTKGQIIDGAKAATDKIEEGAKSLIDKTGQTLAAASETTKVTADATKETTVTVFQDVKDSGTDGVAQIEHFFSGLGKKAKDIKEDASLKAKDAGKAVADTTKEAADATEKKTAEFAKQSGEALKDAQQYSMDKASKGIGLIKETKQTAADKTDQVAKSASETGQDIKDSTTESFDKIGGFFSGLGRKLKDTRADTSQKMKETEEAAVDTTKGVAQTAKQEAAELSKQTGEALRDAKKQTVEGTTMAVDKAKEGGQMLADKTGQVFTDVSQATREKTDVMKEDAQAISQDVKDTGAEAIDRIGGFFGGLSKKAENEKDRISQKAKDIGKTVSDTTQEAADTTEKKTTEIAKQTSETLKGAKKITVIGTRKALDEIKDAEQAIAEKTDQTITSTSEAEQDIKDTATEGLGKISGFFSSFGKATKEAKEDAALKMKGTGATVADTTKQAAETVGQFAKQTTETLKDARDQTVDETIIALDKIKGGKILADKTEEKTDSIKQDVEPISQGVRDTTVEGIDKVGGFFSGFGKKAKDAKDDISQKVTDAGKTITDTTKETAVATKKKTAESTKQAGEALKDTKEQIVEGVEKAADNFKQTGQAVANRTDRVVTFAADTATEKADSTKQAFQTVSQGIKDSATQGADKIGGFFSGLGKKVKGVEEDVTQKVEKATDEALKGAKEQSTEAAKTAAEEVKSTEKIIMAKTGEIITSAGDKTKEEADSIKETTETVSQDLKDLKTEGADKIGGFFSGLDKKIKSVKDDVAQKVKDTSSTTVDATTQARKATEEKTTELAKQTVEGAKVAIDKTKEDGQVLLDKTDDMFSVASEKAMENVHSVSKDAQTISKDVKDTAEKGVDKIGEFFSDLAKKTGGAKDDISQKIKDTEKTVTETTEEATKATVDLAKQTGEASKDAGEQTVDRVITATDKMKEAGQAILDKTDEIAAFPSEVAKEKVDSLKQTSETASQDVKHTAAERIDTIEEFLSGLGKKAKGTTDEVTQKMKDTGASVVDTTKEAAKIAEHKTKEALKDAKEQTVEGATATVDKIKDSGQVFTQKTDQVCAEISETTKEKAESVKKGTKAISKVNVKHTATKGADKIGGFFSGLGKKTKGAKEDISQNATKESTIATEKKSVELAKQTDEFLKDARQQTMEEVKTQIDEVKAVIDKADHVVTSAERTTKEKADSVEETTKTVSQDIKDTTVEGLDKIGGFFGGLGKKVKGTKDDVSQKLEETGATVIDSTKQTVQTAEKKATELATQTSEALQEAKGQTVDGTKTATSKVKQVGQVIVDKTDQVFASAVETGKEKADSIKETTGTITRDVKDAAIGSVDKIGGFFNGLGKKSKDAKDNVSQKAEAAGKVIADTTTETVEATEQKIIDSSREMGEALKDAKQRTMDTAQTGVDKLKTAGQKVIDKTDQIVTSAAETTKQKTDSMKQAAGTVSEDASNIAAEGADKVGAFFSSLDKTAKSAGDDVSQKVKDTEKAVVSATEETVKATQQKTTELTKQTGKTLKEAKEKTVDGVGAAIGQVKETGQEGVGKAEVETIDKGKGAIESIKEAKEGITGLFSGFGKKKDKKKDKRKQGGAKERVSTINQQIGGDLSDINQFLAEERDKMAEERMTTPETKVKSEISQSPVVTSPTLPRRVASHRIARGDVPYFVEVTNLPYDDSSSDESYIVTEPTERLSARISDESSIDSLHIKKPLFHIESEDSFDASHRGSIISNDNLSAQRPETLVTDLDDFDDIASSDTQFTSNVLFKGSTDAKTASQIDTDLIEKKLSDIEKALGTLEHAETIESTQIEKPSLKRVERKFERMASELLAADSVKAKDSNLTTPEMEEKHEQDFRKIVSQLSTEEMSDCQKEYAALWDEQTFSPSEGCDTSKTPDSQAEVLELPQGEASGLQQQRSEQPTAPQTLSRAEAEETSGQRQSSEQERPITDQHMLSDEMKKLLKELEEESKK